MPSNMYYHHQLPLRQSSPVAMKLHIPPNMHPPPALLERPPSVADTTTDFESENEQYSMPTMKQGSRVPPPLWPNKKRQSPESLETLYSKALYMMEALSDSDSSGDQSLSSTKSSKSTTSASSLDGTSTPDDFSFSKLSLDRDKDLDYETPDTEDYDFTLAPGEVTQGPKGPHLFFSPRDDERKFFMDPNYRPMSTISAAIANLDESEYNQWTPAQVCSWMKELGFEDALISKFKENDVSGIVLSELKWEDLRELDIQSFGKRIELWSAVNKLRGSSAPSSPSRSKPSSPILESPRSNLKMDPGSDSDEIEAERERQTKRHQKRSTSRRRRETRQVPPSPSVVTPEDSVSMRAVKINSDDEVSAAPAPAPKSRKHKCSKGARCAKHGRKHKSRRAPSPGDSSTDNASTVAADGSIVVGTTPSLVKYGMETFAQEVIDDPNEVSSLVQSSDALGNIGYQLELKADTLRDVRRVDPQENVRHFVALQHLQAYQREPSTPVMVPDQLSVEIMRSDLIRDCSSPPTYPFERCKTPRPVANSRGPSLALRTKDLPPMPYGASISRTANYTPFSDLDVPRTQTISPVYPVRELSNSVPPDMRYRQMASGPAQGVESLPPMDHGIRRTNSPLEGSAYMSPVDEMQEFEEIRQPSQPVSPTARLHVGVLRKRRTNLFRHEWKTYHCRLQGTRLGFYVNEACTDEIGFIDMNYYTVGCASASKPAGVFKVNGKSSDSEGNFFFQLIPNMDGGRTKGHGVGKVHYLATVSKEERYTWMRELMLSKVAGKKDNGFAVEINGNVL